MISENQSVISKEEEQPEGTPLFTAQTVWTEEEYIRFNMACLAEQLEKARKAYLVISGGILLAGIAVLAISGGPDPLGIFFVLFGASYYFLIMARMRRRLRRVAREAWESDRTLQDSVRRYFFYEDQVTAVSEHGELRLRYEDIYRVIATETNLYIMLGKAQGLNLVRADCPPGLIAFVEKLGDRQETPGARGGRLPGSPRR